MNLFIDGDAFPNLLKPIVFRSIKRLNLTTYVVSNKKIAIGEDKNIYYIIVDIREDEADHKIIEMLQEGDLVITADIPLANRVINENAHAIDHRGKLYSINNIQYHLAMRNLMQNIRDSGEITRGPAVFGTKDAHLFANEFSKFLAKNY